LLAIFVLKTVLTKFAKIIAKIFSKPVWIQSYTDVDAETMIIVV